MLLPVRFDFAAEFAADVVAALNRELLIFAEHGRHGVVGPRFDDFHAADVFIAAIDIEFLADADAIVDADRKFDFAVRDRGDNADDRNLAGVGRILDRHAQAFEQARGVIDIERELFVAFLEDGAIAVGLGQAIGQFDRAFDLGVGFFLEGDVFVAEFLYFAQRRCSDCLGLV